MPYFPNRIGKNPSLFIANEALFSCRAKTKGLVKVPPSLMNTLSKMDLVNAKQCTNGTSLPSPLQSSVRRTSLPSNLSGGTVETRKVSSPVSLTSSANTSAKGTSHCPKSDSPEIRLRQQLKKHMVRRKKQSFYAFYLLTFNVIAIN